MFKKYAILNIVNFTSKYSTAVNLRWNINKYTNTSFDKVELDVNIYIKTVIFPTSTYKENIFTKN